MIIACFLSLVVSAAYADQAKPIAEAFSLPILASGETSSLPILASGTEYQFEPVSGQVTYLDFWASWCGPCKLSFPDMKILHTEFADKGLRIIAVSVDEKSANAEKFLKRFDPNFTVLLDTTGDIAAKYQIPAMQTSFLIDQNGRVREIHAGYRPGDIEQLRASITKLLNESH